MLHEAYFLIEPLSHTRAELARLLDDDVLALLCSPQSISHQYADKSGWSAADSSLVAKLACLAQMLDIFPDATKRVEIFGAAEISEAVFDRWWTIRPVEHLGRTTEYVEELKLFSDQLVTPDRPRVADWLRLREI